MAHQFLDLITEAFAHHRSYRETGQRGAYDQWVEDFKERVKQAIEKWRPKSGYSAGLLLKSLLDKSHQWWYFLYHPEVPPDNNRAERCLRLGVTPAQGVGRFPLDERHGCHG